MNYRRLGKTDLVVSALGLGCQSLGGGLYHRDDRESERTLLDAVAAGITFFDVSDHHSLGATERLLGRVLKGVRDRVVITTKAGYGYHPATRIALQLRGLLRPVSRALRPAKRSLHKIRLAQGRYAFQPGYLISAVERSLHRLQTDYLDLFQLYKPPAALLRRGDLYEPLERLRTQGKIRHYGVACLTVEDAMIALQHDGNASVQVAINFLERAGVDELLARARHQEVGVIARHPRAIGLLTNGHDDLMGDASAYEEQYQSRVRMAHALRGLIRPDRSLAQAAIQFVLAMDGVTVVLPRAVNRRELLENLGSATAPPLTAQDMAALQEITGGRPTLRPARAAV